MEEEAGAIAASVIDNLAAAGATQHGGAERGHPGHLGGPALLDGASRPHGGDVTGGAGDGGQQGSEEDDAGMETEDDDQGPGRVAAEGGEMAGRGMAPLVGEGAESAAAEEAAKSVLEGARAEEARGPLDRSRLEEEQHGALLAAMLLARGIGAGQVGCRCPAGEGCVMLQSPAVWHGLLSCCR